MKSLFLVTLIVFSFLTNYSSAQLMINGGFEQALGPIVTVPGEPTNDYLISRSPGWVRLNNTPDIVYSGSGLSAYTGYSRTGSGCGHYGYAANQPYSDEYFYGTTQPLTAGSTYVVSFWIRKDQFTILDYQVGAFISASVPSPFAIDPYSTTLNPTPLVTDLVTSNTYQKVSFCYTPTQNGTHYLTIGSFIQNILTGTYENNVVFYIDDVDVSLLPAGSNPQSIISPTNPVFCSTSNVILDGSQSLNSQEYEWKIFEVISGNETLVYDGPRITGTPNSFNASSSIPGGLLAGSCYKAYLTVYNGCENTTSVDFCVENPQISFLNGNEAVCGNSPLNLEVTGDNGWTYSWSSGQTGVGLKNVTVTPAPPAANYSVTATTPLGCTVTKNISLTVHDPNNVAPWMDGINGTGEYTIYVNQGEEVNFTSTLYNDHSNEEVVNNIIPPSIPSIFFSTSYPIGNTGIFNFSLNAGFGILPDLPMGSYPFTVTTTDKNACENKGDEFIFTVKVICKYCDVCVGYENRTPTNFPLPHETLAGECINAGFSQTVSTGEMETIFQAGESIDLGPYFEAGTNFSAFIDNGTCITECFDCCDDFSGFTVDLPLQNIMALLPDGTLSLWEANDIDNPYCAYNAKKYAIEIRNISNELVYEYFSDENPTCCGYVSKSPSNPIPNSSIFWDGRANVSTWDGNYVTEGVYQLDLKLYSCGTEELFETTINVYSSLGKSSNSTSKSDLVNEILDINSDITIFPIPSDDFIRIDGINYEDYEFEIFNSLGQNMKGNYNFEENIIDIKQFSPGHYHIKIKSSNQIITKEFIVL